MTLNVFSIDYQATAVSSLQSCHQLTESRVSNQRLVWIKLKVFWIHHYIFSSVSSLQSSVVEVLADQKRKGRPPKPDRPSASERKFPCVFCEKRYGTKQSLQVKCYNIIDEMKWFIFVYQVHVSTKHRAEKKAQRGRLMGTSDFIVWFCILYFNIWHLMRIKRWIKVYAESLMLDVYLLYLGWCSKSVMLNDIWCAMTVYSNKDIDS